MTEPELTHHEINYVEIPVTDMAASRKFYADAFDWSFNDYGPDYAGIRRADGNGEVGGLRPVDSVTPGGVLVILYSADLEASVEKVEAAGGKITIHPFSFPGGRRFHFEDPNGHELAVWSEK